MLEEVARVGSSMRRVRRWADFADWLAPDVNIAYLKRSLSPSLREASCATLASLHTPWLTTVVPGELTPRDALQADIARLCELLADLTGCDRVGVRLTRVERPMCCRWHVDWVSARLTTAYVGPGSELVSGHEVARELLGSPSLTSVEGVEALRAGARIQRTDTADVVLLKGERWPGNLKRGAVHRSPHASPEAPRLLLTLDALFDDHGRGEARRGA